MTPEPLADKADAVVVGAGIVGLATARELLLRRPGERVVVLEREDRVAAHQSSHNSGVIHAGVYYEPGSLKARLCVEGARDLYAFCEQNGIAHRRCGKLIVAVEERELGRLDELERRAAANGVAARRLSAAQIAGVEPACRGLAALHVPETGVVDFGQVTAALAQQVADLGGVVLTGADVLAARGRGAGVAVRVSTGGDLRAIDAGCLIACAGAWSDRLAVASGAPADPRVVPFRGAYCALRPERAELVRALVYPVPDPSLPFLGVHLTRGISGVVHIGPTALLAGARDAYALRRVRSADVAATLGWPGTWRMARRWWRTGAHEIALAASRRTLARAAARYVPGIVAGDLMPAGAGVRAQALGRDGELIDDFVVSHHGAMLHVRNAPSPAATSALALARHIADRAGA